MPVARKERTNETIGILALAERERVRNRDHQHRAESTRAVAPRGWLNV